MNENKNCFCFNSHIVTINTGIFLDGKTTIHSGHFCTICAFDLLQNVYQLRHECDIAQIGFICHTSPLSTTKRPQGGLNPIRYLFITTGQQSVCYLQITDPIDVFPLLESLMC